MFYVYILKVNKINNKILYIGYTSDLRKRLRQHLLNRVRTTRNRNPKLIYYEAYSNKYLALKREKGIKASGSVYMALIKRLDLK